MYAFISILKFKSILKISEDIQKFASMHAVPHPPPQCMPTPTGLTRNRARAKVKFTDFTVNFILVFIWC